MSGSAQVRIAWGGKEAVETVAKYPSMIDCETVVFGPKLSYAVIAREELSSEHAAKKLARRVSVDVSVFDQSGCASPHNLYIEKGGIVTPERFCEILAEAFPKTEAQIPKPFISPEQISAVHSSRECMILKVEFGEVIRCHGQYSIQRTMNFVSQCIHVCLWYIRWIT